METFTTSYISSNIKKIQYVVFSLYKKPKNILFSSVFSYFNIGLVRYGHQKHTHFLHSFPSSSASSSFWNGNMHVYIVFTLHPSTLLLVGICILYDDHDKLHKGDIKFIWNHFCGERGKHGPFKGILRSRILCCLRIF